MMNEKIVILLAELDLLLYDEINDWAIKCLEQGFNSRSLRELAAMRDNYSSSEYDDFLKRSLNELGWDKFTREEYLIHYAEIVAVQIVKDEKEPIEAAKEIYDILLSLDYPEKLMVWIEIDEMIWDYKHFLDTGYKGYYFREKAELIKEIKELAKETIKK